ncbi:hypothetical protein [Cryobacterium sp. N19]|uniref:hypothetical protein n=1 Tax=Cryobacterium sp. N19 TaxID=2048288 RepID=UPI001124FDFF|nr:hypothetical protein [Cryobacterium sp. N19]
MPQPTLAPAAASAATIVKRMPRRVEPTTATSTTLTPAGLTALMVAQPGVLAVLAIGAAVLVTWTFWPRREREDTDRDDDRDRSSDAVPVGVRAADSDAAGASPTPPGLAPDPSTAATEASAASAPGGSSNHPSGRPVQ